MSEAPVPRLERLPDVCSRTGLSKSTIYRLIDQKEFPGPIPIHGRTVAWNAADIDSWINAKITAAA